MQYGQCPFGRLFLVEVNVSAFNSSIWFTCCALPLLLYYYKPWFLDGKLTSYFRSEHHIDGSFLATDADYIPLCHTPSSILRFNWNDDPAYKDGSFFDFISTISPGEIWRILEQGKEYARWMEEKGGFKTIPKNWHKILKERNGWRVWLLNPSKRSVLKKRGRDEY